MAGPTNGVEPAAGRRERRTRVASGILWSAAAAVAGLQVWAAFHRPAYDQLADLGVYLGSVRLLGDGGSLYDFAAAHNGAPFTYPPFAGLVLFPVGLLADVPARVGWTALTVLAVVLLALPVRRPARPPLTAPTPVLTPLVALALFASAPVSSNLRFGQVSLFLVVAVLADMCGGVP